MPLSQSDTIILGYHSELFPFSAELDSISAKYVYVESLTEEQKKIFISDTE